MVTVNSRSKAIILLLLKDFSKAHTITSLAKELNMSRVGIWKIIKRLESEQIIALIPVGSGKTSASIIKLNWENILIEKSLSLYLAEESIKQRRWALSFAELSKFVDFLIIFGSVLYSPKEAGDIDIINVLNKRNFIKLQKAVEKAQKSQIKKIHAINFTKEEFKKELNGNRAIIEAVKNGIVLFGQEKFVKLMRTVKCMLNQN